MKSVGIIAEYNPFHNGHLYHLNKVKELYPDAIIVLVLSGPFLQRGNPSILNKWDKTEIALEYGIDLVIELPFPFATQSADIFAKGAIQILNHLHVDTLVFGSEQGDINLLNDLVDCQLYNKDFDLKVKEYLDEGINYPTALSKTLSDLTNYNISAPNDLLALSYIKEIKKLNSKIKPICIKRTNDYHSLELNTEITSATSIRHAINQNKDIKKYVPELTLNYINKNVMITDDYYSYLKYKIICDINNLEEYQTVDEGIENRIKKSIYNSNNLEELIMNIKTKRYTYNKINRMFTHILCNFKKEEANKFNDIQYIRLLGFNNKGKNYLNKIKKEISIPLITKYSDINNEMLELEFRANSIYAIISKCDKLINLEYQSKPIIKK
ncbi:MAG: nucleotidyltransferase [Bacilli bacterium]|nr:nucleotidyltransferase [Bacilli bacterium]MDD4608095.1 nucleotidyltransferase [Bacilli bacterium]